MIKDFTPFYNFWTTITNLFKNKDDLNLDLKSDDIISDFRIYSNIDNHEKVA